MTKQKKLRVLGRSELSAVHGGFLIPAVQKIRDVATPTTAGTIYLKFEGISGDATE